MMSPLDLPHVRALCAALDAGDDLALPVLADALEECSEDRLASGLRQLGGQPNRRQCRPAIWGEQGFVMACGYDGSGWARPELYSRLAGGQDGLVHGTYPARFYPTRSAAYLALAAALTT